MFGHGVLVLPNFDGKGRGNSRLVAMPAWAKRACVQASDFQVWYSQTIVNSFIRKGFPTSFFSSIDSVGRAKCWALQGCGRRVSDLSYVFLPREAGGFGTWLVWRRLHVEQECMHHSLSWSFGT